MSTFNLAFEEPLKALDVSESVQGDSKPAYQRSSVQQTLNNKFVPTAIRDARGIQDEILKERFGGQSLAIADIGCGDGYHGKVFGPDAKSYHGFEISSEMAQKSRKCWHNIDGARVFEGDASSMLLSTDTYDIAWSLYFTSGNFRQKFKDLLLYDDAYLNNNPAFIGIVNRFYEALKQGGKLFLTVYKDVPETEAAQRELYKNTGQTVVTPLGSRFVATKEDFWSVRWTEESMLSNLRSCGIEPNQVVFNDLNDVAWMVEVTR